MPPFLSGPGGHSYTGGSHVGARSNPPVASRQTAVSTNAIPRVSRKHIAAAASCSSPATLANSASQPAFVISSSSSTSSPGVPTPRASFDEVEVPEGSLRGKLRISLDLEAEGNADSSVQPVAAFVAAVTIPDVAAVSDVHTVAAAKTQPTIAVQEAQITPTAAPITSAAESSAVESVPTAAVPTPSSTPAPVLCATLVSDAAPSVSTVVSAAPSPRLSAHAPDFVPPAHVLQQKLSSTSAVATAVTQPAQSTTASAAAVEQAPSADRGSGVLAISTLEAATQPEAQPIISAAPAPTIPVLTHSDAAVQCDDDFVATAASTVPSMLTQRSPESVSGTSSALLRDKHNSVTIKLNDTLVKDSAGAIYKVLQRLSTVFVTALHDASSGHESLNRAVKAIAVARKYVKDHHPGEELSFLPFNRSNEEGVQEPHLFAFLAFRTVVSEVLKMHDRTDLNVSSGSDANKMANAIISVVLDRGQAVMKAGGSAAIFVAMTAVVNARRRLKAKHGIDLMLIPAWITEETTWLGRESKFLRFNILRCALHGPYEACNVHPSQSSYEGPAFA